MRIAKDIYSFFSGPVLGAHYVVAGERECEKFTYCSGRFPLGADRYGGGNSLYIMERQLG